MNIDISVYVASGAKVIGKVNIGENSSVWFNAVIRGDSNSIDIGKNSNVQDNSTLHTSSNHSLIIGDFVTIGHGCIIHGCKLGNNVLVGMGSIILDGAIIADNCIIGAGTLITQNKIIPSNSLVFGNPMKIIRNLTIEEINSIKENALMYVKEAEEYKIK